MSARGYPYLGFTFTQGEKVMPVMAHLLPISEQQVASSLRVVRLGA